MQRIAIALLFFVVLVGCAPSEVGRRWADGIDHTVQAPALAASEHGSFDNPWLRWPMYPIMVPTHMALGFVEGFWNGWCAFLEYGKCEPWVADPPYSIVVESWQ
jgi:hypothetical protein